MSCGERPIGAAKGKQSDTEALCQSPPPNMVPKDGPGTAVHSCGACWWAGLLTTASKEDTQPWTECKYSGQRYFCNALATNGAERRRYYCNALPASHTLVS